jgi:putative copper resistance protein D
MPTLLALARTLHIGSAMLLVALPYFILFVARTDDAAGGDERDFRARMQRWWWGAWLVEAASGAVWVWLATAQMSDDAPGQITAQDLETVLWQTWFGQLWLARAAVGFALGALGYFSGRWYGLTLALSVALLISLAGAGHADAGVDYHLLHLAIDGLHLFLGAIWPMGLLPLGLFLRDRAAQNGIRAGERELAILRRFSRVSVAVVLLLLITGVINSWLMLRSWEDFGTTLYGRLLLAKILVVLMMIFLGALNRRALAPQRSGAPEMLGRMKKNIAVESCLGAIVLLLVGIMGMTAPPS